MSSRRRKERDVEPEGGEEHVFPDLHHKMSKKIAQLTKVIYHLNTKNEDNQSMIEALQAQHRVEIDVVAKEALTRMATTKELAEMKQKMLATAAQMEKLNKKHADDKAKTIADFEKFKNGVKEREDKYTSEFEQKYDFLNADYEKANASFQSKLSAFEDTKRRMQERLEYALASGGDVAADLKKAHEKELQECIREANDKYQAMLVEQLSKQEQLKKEHEERAEKLKAESEREIKARMETELGQLRASLNGAKQEALMAAKREHDAKLQELRDDSSSKLEKALAAVKAKSNMCESLQDEIDALKKQLDDAVRELETKLQASMGDADHRIQELNIALAQEQAKGAKVRASLQEAEENGERLEKLLGEKNVVLAEKSADIDRLGTEVDKMRADLLAEKERGSATSGELSSTLSRTQQQLIENEKELERLRKEKSRLENSLGAAQEEITSLQDMSLKAKKTLEGQIAEKQSEINKLLNQLKETTGTSAAEASKLHDEVVTLRLQLAKQESDSEQAKKLLLETHAQAVTLLDNKHNAALSTKEKVIEGLEERNQHLVSDLAAKDEEYKSLSAALRAEHSTEKTEIEAAHNEEITKLKVIVAQLESEIASLSENADSEKAGLQKDYQKVQEKYKSLKVELEAKKREGEMAQGTISGLKNQIDDLREELKSTQRAYKEKMDMSLAKLEEDWQTKMQAAEDKHCDDLAALRADLEGIWDKERQALVSAHDDTVKGLEAALSSNDASGRAAVQAIEKERVRLEVELESERTDRHNQVNAINVQHAEVVEQLHKEREAALASLREQLAGAADANTEALLAKHKGELDALKVAAQEAAAAAEKAQVAAVAAQKKEDDENMIKKMSELEARLKLAATEAADKAAAAEQSARSKLEDDHARALAATQEELLKVQSDLSTTAEQLNATKAELSATDATLKKTKIEAAIDKEQLVREGETAVRQEKEASQRALLAEKERNDAELRLLKGEFREDRDRFDETLAAAHEEYRVLEERYENRESRPEDMLRIAELEKECQEKEELVKTTREEMIYFKRELVNREENFNSKFSAKPNVGVMNVLPTAGDSKSKSVGGVPKSNKPRNIVGGGGGVMGGVGGMGGMSIGGPAPGIPGANKGPAVPGSRGR